MNLVLISTSISIDYFVSPPIFRLVDKISRIDRIRDKMERTVLTCTHITSRVVAKLR